jgi:predicted nuclease of restriction endonuclease-like (RecB) superfamily
MEKKFIEIIKLIKQSQLTVLKVANAELINLYWNVGEYIHKQIELSEWGNSIVEELSNYIEKNEPGLKGFSDKNLWRMKQFYETYNELPKLSPLVREISWTNNLLILSRTKTLEEKEFYLKICKQENYSKRELDRQITASLYERTMLGDVNISPITKEIYPNAINTFKDSYLFDFLNLPEQHNENQLQKGLIAQMKNFILELGKDFIFIGEEFKVEVGSSDFYIDLLFYHRGLQCLVAFELKTTKFKPEHLGQLNFYLEALDRDVKKKNENPSIGILLCKDKDNEVVEYAMSRNLSPTMVAEYKTQLPDKKLLQARLHEIFESGENKE